MRLFHELASFYRAPGHRAVVHLIERGVDLRRFRIIDNGLARVWIPGNLTEPAPMLCAHSDTVFDRVPGSIIRKKGVLRSGDGDVGLGADDRNGCYLLHRMMRSRPDRFLFALFDLEEQACLGSRSFDVQQVAHLVSVFIGLDRRGGDEIALYGFENTHLLNILDTISHYRTTTGSMTDCAVLAEESGLCCFNLSAGYRKEHTPKESTDLSALCKTEHLLHHLPTELWGRQFHADPDLFQYSLPFRFSLPW